MIDDPMTVLHAGTVISFVSFGDLTIRVPELRVHLRERELNVSLAQLRLLMIFLSDPYGRFTSDELVRRLQLPSKQALNVLICGVRELLDQKYIFTVRGYGYAFALEKP